jgi:hypothetical protein
MSEVAKDLLEGGRSIGRMGDIRHALLGGEDD